MPTLWLPLGPHEALLTRDASFSVPAQEGACGACCILQQYGCMYGCHSLQHILRVQANQQGKQLIPPSLLTRESFSSGLGAKIESSSLHLDLAAVSGGGSPLAGACKKAGVLVR
jgi:hypothetical protein